VWAGGRTVALNNGINVIDYVTIASIGNAVDFGDLVSGDTARMSGCSNTNGGL
jgi:hypothetical protein